MFPSAVTLLLQCIYIVCVAGLSVYGANALWLTILYWRTNQTIRSTENPDHVGYAQTVPRASLLTVLPYLPNVTVQLPIYNEQHVVIRLLQACTRMRYPKNCLQIQVLDDSDDDTSHILRAEVAKLRGHGHQIDIVTRRGRSGYKAGALQNGLASARGEFIAIFDADFEPTPSFLKHTLPHFFDSDNQALGFIQTRWEHLNASYSPLTQSQALALDGHFAVEQAARQAHGYLFGFNGSGGIWRRTCIDDPQVGGWQTDTLCEDLDLSYRAQLAGWRGRFLAQVTSPAEIPPQLFAFKRQQFRWAKGSLQTLRKLGARVLRSQRAPGVKAQALVHLGSYLVHPLLLTLLIISLPLALLPTEPIVPLPWLSVTSFGPPLLYAVAQLRLNGSNWWRRWRYLPLLTLLGTGLSLNNTIAACQGLARAGGEFQRTPKFNIEKRSDQWRNSRYRLGIQPIIIGELALMLYALLTAAVLILQQNWWTLPFILLYAGGFGLMAGVGLWQSRPQGITAPAHMPQSRRTGYRAHQHAPPAQPAPDHRTARALRSRRTPIGNAIGRPYGKHRAQV